MERLTKRENGHAHYPRCFEEPCGGMGCRTDDCEFKDEICDRLAAYEDTGLEPEEVLQKDKADEIALKLMRLADLESICSYTRLRELAEADKDGRLVVLPYKVGQRVFALLDTDKHISECEVKRIGLGNEIGFAGLEPIGARGREYGVSLNGFGKTVFLTREEAEKALEAMKNE
nr:MAG TPA: hypothetical protein [Caudoviricetes sp.]